MNIDLLKQQQSRQSSDKLIAAIIRVNHAGEYGAKRIYDGQLQTIHNSVTRNQIAEMRAQELVHLKYFEQQLPAHKVRPTLLLPLWHIGGFMLGAITGFLGKKTAMLCTDAVEEIIAGHYQSQIDDLSKLNDISAISELSQNIAKFRAEELEHQQIATDGHTGYNPLQQLLYIATQTICRIAISLSKVL